VPTGHGASRLRHAQYKRSTSTHSASDRTAEPVWPTVGVGLHLLSPGLAGDGRACESSSHDASLGYRAVEPAASPGAGNAHPRPIEQHYASRAGDDAERLRAMRTKREPRT
jgi:hypothetical protein